MAFCRPTFSTYKTFNACNPSIYWKKCSSILNKTHVKHLRRCMLLLFGRHCLGATISISIFRCCFNELQLLQSIFNFSFEISFFLFLHASLFLTKTISLSVDSFFLFLFPSLSITF